MKTTVEKLIQFVNQRPGLEFANYGDIRAYNAESREITRDRSDFYELLGLASSRIDDLNGKLTAYLLNNSGRLTMNEKGNIEYCTGQYFPTEYRPAACRVLANLIWADYRDEMTAENKPVYATGHDMRKAIKRRGLSRRTYNNYFN